jgi:hypothetical protein
MSESQAKTVAEFDLEINQVMREIHRKESIINQMNAGYIGFKTNDPESVHSRYFMAREDLLEHAYSKKNRLNRQVSRLIKERDALKSRTQKLDQAPTRTHESEPER